MTDPPRSARVVVVGAGIVGASVAYHLTLQGWTDIVVVEQGPLWETGGSTSHAPGLVFQLNPSRTMTQMARWTTELLGSLELDGQPCWHGVGGIEVATTPERMAELDRRWGRAQGYGLTDAELVTADEVAALVPLVDPDRILGGLHVPSDGIAKALRAAEVLGRASGAAAFGDCEVTGFDIVRGRVRGVETTRGAIATDTVVLCAGIWGAKASRLAGIDLPIAPLQHQYGVTAPLPALQGETREVVHPILRHQDHSMYFRQQADRYGIGNYRHEPRLTEPEDIAAHDGEQPSIVAFTPSDWATAAREAGVMLPALQGIDYERTFNGLMSFTPDGFPLLGETGTVRGLWLAEAIWVTHAGGAGRALAELMTHGDSVIDLHECDPERYDGHGLSRTYSRARASQGYREVYDVIHPRQQSEQVRGLRRTPFYWYQRALGACFFESAGWERPQWYDANASLLDDAGFSPASTWAAREWSPIVVAEHLACRERAGIFDLSPFTKLEVSGPGAPAFLQRLAANDVDRAIGTIVYTAMLSPRGGIMCDLTITRLGDDRFWVVTGGAVGKHDLAWMRRHLPADGSVTIFDRTSGLACIGVWGPRARDLVASVCEDDLSNEAFPYMSARALHVGAVPVRALRLSYVGELGWEIYTPTEFGGQLWETLWGAGESVGAVACGGAAYDALRLEKGYRLWGQDIDEEHNAYEAGLGWAVRLGKGDFIGRAAAERVKEEGVTRRLACMVTDDPSVVLVGKEPILDGDVPLGYVTSAGYGAAIRQSILYGYLPVSHAEVGTALTVHSEGARHAVTVAADPLFDPAMERLKDVRPAAAV